MLSIFWHLLLVTDCFGNEKDHCHILLTCTSFRGHSCQLDVSTQIWLFYSCVLLGLFLHRNIGSDRTLSKWMSFSTCTWIFLTAPNWIHWYVWTRTTPRMQYTTNKRFIKHITSVCSQADIVPFGSTSSSTNSLGNFQTNNSTSGPSSQSWIPAMRVSRDPWCPVDHSKDQEIVQTFYKLVKTYTLPKLPNINLKTVHRCALVLDLGPFDLIMLRCFLSEIGPIHRNGAELGDGGTAAVIVRDGRSLGLLYIEWVAETDTGLWILW